MRGKAAFRCNRNLRQGRMEAPRLWQKGGQPRFGPMWKKNGLGKEGGILLDLEGEGCTSNMQLYVGRQLLDHVTLKSKFWNRCFETLLKKHADGTWYPNQRVCGGQVHVIQKRRLALTLGTTSGCCKFLFEDAVHDIGLCFESSRENARCH